MHSKAQHIPAGLSAPVGRDPKSQGVADLAVCAWQQVDAILSPIIGNQGMAALYKRSLYLTSSTHRWLLPAYQNALAKADFVPLHQALAGQSEAHAQAASIQLRDTFNGLLTKLIGSPLTARLLRSVWDKLSDGQAVQDTSP